MKFSYFFSALLLLPSLFFNFSRPYPLSGLPDSGLVAHYTFNKCKVEDITGNNPDGEVAGHPGCHCGVEGNALFFDGLNDHITFPGLLNRYFGTTDFTISFYIKPGKYSVFGQSLLAKRENCESYNMLDLQLDVVRKEIKTDLYETPYKFFSDISPETPPTDWIHFALVREGLFAYTYINGQLIRTARRCSGVDLGNAALLSFANSPCISTGRTVRFKGGLDELRIYNRALSEKEINKLYLLHPVESAELDCITFVGRMLSAGC